jgi:hypothetical protein
MVPIDEVPMAVLSVATVAEGVSPFDEPPWPTPSETLLWNWERFERYPNHITASIVAGRLEADGVPTIVEAVSAFPGVFCATIWVPKELMHRARWVLAWPAPTDSELTFLATGELLPEGEKE